MTGFLLQWPTLVTLVLYPVMLVTYSRLARREEHDSLARFGGAYAAYMQEVPAFVPRVGGGRPRPAVH
jgi:protein-S-isoprenylcysteine O-methyltransferase Ste14